MAPECFWIDIETVGDKTWLVSSAASLDPDFSPAFIVGERDWSELNSSALEERGRSRDNEVDELPPVLVGDCDALSGWPGSPSDPVSDIGEALVERFSFSKPSRKAFERRTPLDDAASAVIPGARRGKVGPGGLDLMMRVLGLREPCLQD